jgi:hypothetical protein
VKRERDVLVPVTQGAPVEATGLTEPVRLDQTTLPAAKKRRSSKIVADGGLVGEETEPGGLVGAATEPLPLRFGSSEAPQKFGSPEEVQGKGSKREILDQIARDLRERKAVKSDDAAIPEYLWEEHLTADDVRVWTPSDRVGLPRAMDLLRARMLRWWKKRVTTSYLVWLKEEHPRLRRKGASVIEGGVDAFEDAGGTAKCWWRDRKDGYRWKSGGRQEYQKWWRDRFTESPRDWWSGRDAITRAARTSWWSWDDGSTPLYWRWPAWYQGVMRDGLKVHFQADPPRYKRAQRDSKDPVEKGLVIQKLKKVRERRYIAEGYVVSLTSFFPVEKGDDDIRMVYDGSVSGLNDAMWVSRFVLPTINTHLRAVEEQTYMADVDVGEMFLNFILHEDLRSLSGVDLTCFFPSKDGAPVWETWQRAAMGLKSSPYQCTQAMGVAEEVVRGDRLNATNVFRWDRVRMNLPGQATYDPSVPWVSKVRNEDEKIAADLFTFVDDLRPTGTGKKQSWQAGRRSASVLGHLGIQDASRKRRDSSQTPGAWAGAVVRTGSDGVFVLASEEKWLKAKRLLKEVLELLNADSLHLPRKRLEQIRGFLMYVTRTYVGMAPYMIGFHMTIDSWRKGRDAEGWRSNDEVYWLAAEDGGEWGGAPSDGSMPTTVKAVPRFRSDVEALMALSESDEPPLRRVRCHKKCTAYYGFGDASGAGFGATLQIGDAIYYEYGQWTSEVTETESSNWRELNNLVEALEGACRRHQLSGCELFLFTDNSTAENAFWKGTSTSPKLFALVLRLRKLEMDHDLILHVIHVSGLRMIAQGTDGLSRADHSEGVMKGTQRMEEFMPLHLDPLERSPALRELLAEVVRPIGGMFLTPEGWFTEGHGFGTYVWTPPPAAAEVVVEQLGRARQKRPESMHIVVVPRVMTGRWRRHMTRGSDFYFRVDWPEVWPLKGYFEPLLIFVCLPFRSSSPRLPERDALLEEFRRDLLGDGVREVSPGRRRHLLCKLLKRARALCPL